MNEEALGSLVRFRTGKLNSNASVPDGKYRFFTCSQETYWTNTYAFDTECVLLAGNNANGTYPIKYFSGKFDAYQRTYVIESTDTAKLSVRFLFYALQLQLDHLRSISTGAATKFLTLGLLNSINIPIPSIHQQSEIVSVLAAYDDLIENNTRRIAILEEMARRTYEEWFIRFRFPGHADVSLVESELGLVPEAWSVRRVGDVFVTVLGGTPSRANAEFWINGTVPWINSGKVNETRVVTPSEFITQKSLQKSSAKLMPSGATIIAITGATLGQVSMLGKQMSANQSVVGIFESTGIWSEFIFWSFKSQIRRIIQHASGGAQQHINKDIVNDFELVMPPAKIAEEFKAIVSPMNELVLGLLRVNNNLRTTRDLLLPKLISGKIDVSAVPAPESIAA